MELCLESFEVPVQQAMPQVGLQQCLSNFRRYLIPARWWKQWLGSCSLTCSCIELSVIMKLFLEI